VCRTRSLSLRHCYPLYIGSTKYLLHIQTPASCLSASKHVARVVHIPTHRGIFKQQQPQTPGARQCSCSRWPHERGRAAAAQGPSRVTEQQQPPGTSNTAEQQQPQQPQVHGSSPRCTAGQQQNQIPAGWHSSSSPRSQLVGRSAAVPHLSRVAQQQQPKATGTRQTSSRPSPQVCSTPAAAQDPSSAAEQQQPQTPGALRSGSSPSPQ
jgi:hypothetical protein